MTQDSQGSVSQDPLVLKDSQVSLASPELREDRADQEWTGSPASLEVPDPRASPALDSPVLQVYLEYLELKVRLDPREILVSLAALGHQGDLD